MPKERPYSRRIVEDKLFRFLLSANKMTYKDFYELYCREASEVDTSSGNRPSYSGFMGWLTNYGLKFQRIPGFLDLLGYRLVIVPKDAAVKVSYPGNTAGAIPSASEQTAASIQAAVFDKASGIMTIDRIESPYTLTLRSQKSRKEE